MLVRNFTLTIFLCFAIFLFASFKIDSATAQSIKIFDEEGKFTNPPVSKVQQELSSITGKEVSEAEAKRFIKSIVDAKSQLEAKVNTQKQKAKQLGSFEIKLEPKNARQTSKNFERQYKQARPQERQKMCGAYKYSCTNLYANKGGDAFHNANYEICQNIKKQCNKHWRK